jgi:[CysO sulfur-carrier protein]-S-L-cysteine hydrolase
MSRSEAPAWTRGHVRIQRAALDEVERAARAAYGRDEEACGFLSGPLGDPLLCDRAVELENLANKYHRVDPEGHPRTGREYFKINALTFGRSIERGASEERPVKVFFHSHLDCGAYFSAEDAASMTMGTGDAPTHELAYLVTAVDKGEVTAHRLFIWDDATKSFVEAPFSLEG